MSYAIFIGDLQLPINPETVADSLERKVKEARAMSLSWRIQA